MRAGVLANAFKTKGAKDKWGCPPKRDIPLIPYLALRVGELAGDLGGKVEVGPVGTHGDSVVMVGVYALEDLESEMIQPVDSDGLEALWRRAASWVSNPV